MTQDCVTTPPAPRFFGFQTLSRLTVTPTRWLWHGYVANGSVTLLTSRWKAGKTTLVSVLLSRMQTGGTLAGRPVASGRAIVVSEESIDLWAVRASRLNFGDHISLASRPFRGRPTRTEWEALMADLCDAHTRRRLDLVVIDPLAQFLPGSDENSAASMLAGLAPLQRLTAAGIGVLLLHHPRKEDEQPRGSGALSGFADILIEMSGPRPGGAENRRRRLQSASRFDETPRDLRIELSADGADYTVVAENLPESFADGWAVVSPLLAAADEPLTRREVQARWPEDVPPPSPTVLWRWLERAVAADLAARSGTGQRGDAFRYWLRGAGELGEPT